MGMNLAGGKVGDVGGYASGFIKRECLADMRITLSPTHAGNGQPLSIKHL